MPKTVANVTLASPSSLPAPALLRVIQLSYTQPRIFSYKLLLESQSDTSIGHINDCLLTSVYRAGKVLYPVHAISHLRPTLITS